MLISGNTLAPMTAPEMANAVIAQRITANMAKVRLGVSSPRKQLKRYFSSRQDQILTLLVIKAV